jgi:hypothetical protein
MDSQYIFSRLVIILAFASFGCGDDDTSGTTTSGTTTTSGSGGGGGEGGGSTTGSGGAPPVQAALVSFAHLSPDAPAIELCVSTGEDFFGPVLQGLGVAYSLKYRDVLAPVQIPAGPNTFRIVPADATSCDTPLSDSLDATVPTMPGKAYTLMVVGRTSPPDDASAIQMKGLDADLTPTSGKLKLRFAHVSTSAPNLDLGIGSDSNFQPLFTDVPYGTAGEISGATYLELDPLVDATLSVRRHGINTDVLLAPQISLSGDGMATAFAISDTGQSTDPSHILLCNDSGPKLNFTFITCSVVP